MTIIKKKRGDGGCYGAAAGASGGKDRRDRRDRPNLVKQNSEGRQVKSCWRRREGREVENWKEIRVEEGVKLVPVV